jgi:uncharacterized protein YdaU (DUF1376 family)
MAEYPALPLFTDAFIADTTHLSAAQTGAYLLLLMCAWRSSDCSLPDDDKMLARFARMSPKEWATNRNVIMEFWSKNDTGRFIQKRLVDERSWANDKRDKAITAGKASALKRKKRHSTDVALGLQLGGNHPTPTPTIKDTTSVVSTKNTPKAAPMGKPADVSDQAWKDFIKQRKEKRAAVTETAISRMRQEADKIGWSLEQAIIETCARGWQGFKAQWIINDQQKGSQNAKPDIGNQARDLLEQLR